MKLPASCSSSSQLPRPDALLLQLEQALPAAVEP
jgi:hypothetical protein